ncbi:MAG: tRNA-dihydrouridine synthase [Terracidiphilus sp.]
MPAAARVPAEVRLGAVLVTPATVLAPMAGVTDTVFRRFIRHASLFTTGANQDSDEAAIDTPVTNAQSGCGLLMTEFTSADGLSRMRESKRRRYLTFYDDEHPIGAQLFGSNADTLADAARIVQDTGFDTVDLNLGCPAKRVVGCNGGSGLLRDLPKIADIFRTVRKAVTIPFTVKFRMGWNDAQIVCVEVARMAEAEGLNAVALHARTREQGYSGQAQWEWIARIKQAVRIPVIGNGDIRTPEDASAMIAETGCDAVMIGRAAPANPWIFRQIAQFTAAGAYDLPTVEDRYRMIRTYFAMLLDEAAIGVPTDTFSSVGRESGVPTDRSSSVGPESAGKMKQFASWFTHGVPGGAKLRSAIYHAKTGGEVLARVDEFFIAQLQGGMEMSAQIEDAEAQQYPDAALVCD